VHAIAPLSPNAHAAYGVLPDEKKCIVNMEREVLIQRTAANHHLPTHTHAVFMALLNPS